MPLRTLSMESMERRDCPRHSCAGDRWQLAVAIGKMSWIAQVRDLSPLGLGLLFDCEMEADQLALVELFIPARRCGLLKAIRLHHAALQPDGRCLVGTSFLRRLSDDECAALLDSMREGSSQASTLERELETPMTTG